MARKSLENESNRWESVAQSTIHPGVQKARLSREQNESKHEIIDDLSTQVQRAWHA